MSVNWVLCEGSVWCNFFTVNLSNSHFHNLEGVYVIWCDDGPCLRVGQGDIRDRLGAHRIHPDFRAYKDHNVLVTWASVEAVHRDGVELYLAQELQPVMGQRFPEVTPIPVNLPGQQ